MFSHATALARVRGLGIWLLLFPGAHASGSMLPLASQAELGAIAVSVGPQTWKFDFGPGTVAPGYTRVMPQNIYTREAGFGFEPGSQITCMERGKNDPLRS